MGPSNPRSADSFGGEKPEILDRSEAVDRVQTKACAIAGGPCVSADRRSGDRNAANRNLDPLLSIGCLRFFLHRPFPARQTPCPCRREQRSDSRSMPGQYKLVLLVP